MVESLAQMYITGIWLEAILYGCSCVLFSICLFTLLGHHGASRNLILFKQKHNYDMMSRTLLLSSVVQFSLATAHIIISLLELMAAFATSASAADNYFADPGGNELFVGGFFVYIVNTFAQELLLIWRLYVIWGRNFKICIMPVRYICLIASIAVSGFIPATATPLTRNVHSYGLAGWGLETGVNFLASGGIAYRLWHAGRCTAVLTGRPNYKASFFIIIECGALITTCTTVMFALYAANKPEGLVGVGVATQIATASPLLIIARLGFTMSKRKTIPTATTLSVLPNPLQLNVNRELDTYKDYPRMTFQLGEVD
ncbi:hypothetical protein DFJ58DRAFT_673453 [Suillus subalutaceus]|uniref:uncharacterized protein n=1 Tax=Suillus subalutaceus TaxID=48586 RepID=UPI001B865439|nr:uncharacterized protein DFJ58DRAFT_673453 [Suillus subalutaceus]KAG1817413.1 hypothetical protein DFJ58DRAFT_673453 [Suillus subalutaceus]